MMLDSLFLLVDNYFPRSPLAQTAASIALVALAAVFAQWVVARALLHITGRLLRAAGRADWNDALFKRRAYHKVWYAVPFATVYLLAPSVPHIDRAVVFIKIGRAHV